MNRRPWLQYGLADTWLSRHCNEYKLLISSLAFLICNHEYKIISRFYHFMLAPLFGNSQKRLRVEISHTGGRKARKRSVTMSGKPSVSQSVLEPRPPVHT